MVIKNKTLAKINPARTIREKKIQDGFVNSDDLNIIIPESTVSTAYDSEAIYDNIEDQDNSDVVDCRKPSKEGRNQDVPMHTALKEMQRWYDEHDSEDKRKKNDSDDYPDFNDEYGMK